jgi:hypothetical protein
MNFCGHGLSPFWPSSRSQPHTMSTWHSIVHDEIAAIDHARVLPSIGAVAGLLCDGYLASFLLTADCDNVIKYVLASSSGFLPPQ